jgi:hypothetical protein
MTKVVLAELPYPGRSGPLISCKSLKLREGLSVHWGFVQAAGDIQIDSSDMDNGMDSGFPFDDSGAPGFPRDHISGSKLTSFLNVLDTSIEDPWFGVMAGGGFVTSSGSPLGSQAVQPFPFHCSDANDVSCTDSDHSNLFQNLGPSASPCPDMDYNLWKRTALSGIQHAYYYEYVSSGNFRLNGDPGSPLVTADLATSGRTGLFFFDTADGLPPTDSNGDGVFENLTDDVNFDNGWNSGGFIFLNAGTLSSRGLGNNPPLRSLRAPGEPFIESNGMEGWQNGEAFLRLVYPTSDPTNGDPTYTMIGTASAGRASLGPDLSGMVHMSGVLYNSGYWSAEGGGRFSGSIITRQGVVDRGRGAPEALDIWFDGCLQEGCWPAPPLRLPRVVPTGWENDM